MVFLRRQEPVLQRRKFFQGRSIRGSEVKDLSWFEPSGKEMDDEIWDNPKAPSFGLRLASAGIEEWDETGEPLTAHTLFLMLNAYHEAVTFTLPEHHEGARWERILDTADARWGRQVAARDRQYKLRARSLAVFRLLEPAPLKVKRPRRKRLITPQGLV